jgi:hypothetical protein
MVKVEDEEVFDIYSRQFLHQSMLKINNIINGIMSNIET